MKALPDQPRTEHFELFTRGAQVCQPLHQCPGDANRCGGSLRGVEDQAAGNRVIGNDVNVGSPRGHHEGPAQRLGNETCCDTIRIEIVRIDQIRSRSRRGQSLRMVGSAPRAKAYGALFMPTWGVRK